MAIRYKVYQSEYPYHIYNRTNNKEYIFDLPLTYQIFLESLKFAAKKTQFILHHFVLMTNHYHLMGTTPKANLNEFMLIFQTTFSKRLNNTIGRRNHIFGGRYGATVINTEAYLAHLVRYIYHNPVKADLASSPFTYPFSSLKLYQNGTLFGDGTLLKPDPYLDGLTPQLRFKELTRLCEMNLSDNDYSLIKKKLKQKYFNFEL